MRFCRQGLLVVFALVALACSGSREPQTQGPGSAERPRFVFITNSNSPFWDAARKGLDAAAKEFGADVELIRNDSSPAGQIRRLEQVAAQRDVKGVMVSVVEPGASGIIDQMKALRAKGIPVLAIDSDGQKQTRDAYIGTNNIEAGRVLGQAAAQLLPGGGKAVAFVGVRSAQNAQERVNGFKEGAGARIQVVDVMEDSGDVNKARRNVAAALQNHPDLKMLVGIWSYNAPAIVDEVKAAGKRASLKLVTFDAEPNTLLALKDGMLDATAVQNPYLMGYLGVKVLKALLSKDAAAVKEVVGEMGIKDTGIRLVAPDDSKITSDALVRFSDFKKDLDAKGLTSS
ncbi:MAG: sugar-binding protein [Acidobacteria bacterium]|nr:sugar-binding protein [Acidobacteriota bacterium]MCI0718613.1 sugar-binding protein [Acidobacteriota bacterium]